MNRVRLAPVVLSLLSCPAIAAPPQSAPGTEFEINGFRHAAFGMSESEARTAITTDFPGATIAEATNAAEGTRLLQVSQARLVPGPGPATITYIFGATTRALATIKLAWVLPPSATAAERAAVLAAGMQFAAYFQNQKPQPSRTASFRVISADSVSLYAAIDRKNAAVEVAADGIITGSDRQKTPPAGPVVLRISYIADVSPPDVARAAMPAP